MSWCREEIVEDSRRRRARDFPVYGRNAVKHGVQRRPRIFAT